jgi:hypothetical protein
MRQGRWTNPRHKSGGDPLISGASRHQSDRESHQAHPGVQEVTLIGWSWGALMAGYYASLQARTGSGGKLPSTFV